MENEKNQIACPSDDVLREYISAMIEFEVSQNEINGKQPIAVETIDLRRKLDAGFKRVINEMCKEKILVFHKTLNGVSVEPNKDNRMNE